MNNQTMRPTIFSDFMMQIKNFQGVPNALNNKTKGYESLRLVKYCKQVNEENNR